MNFIVCKMDTLPAELVAQILSNLPKSSLTPCRLVCRSFSTISFPLLFANVPLWLDYNYSHQSIISLTQDVLNRPAVMWSPWALGPDGPAEDVWMGIVWRMLMRTEPPGSSPVRGERGEREEAAMVLTCDNFAELSGREEMSENRLRTSQNLYLLYRAYTEGRDDSKYMEGGLF
jgi:hypothetical protein